MNNKAMKRGKRLREALEGKVALVTGGIGGIGSSIAQQFIAQGAQVVVADLPPEEPPGCLDFGGGSAHYTQANVLEELDIARAIRVVIERFGRLDVFCNGAGAVGSPAPFLESTASEFDAIHALNARSVFFGHKLAAEQFLSQESDGSIITIASSASVQGGWATVSYTAAKHATIGIVRQAAAELGHLGIRANAIAPGIIMTAIQARTYGVPLDRAAEFNGFIGRKLGAKQSSGRFGTPQDVAGVATFLASDLSQYVNGAVIPVDGGALATTQNSYRSEIRDVTRDFLEEERKPDLGM